MSYDIELKFEPVRRRALINALRKFDPALGVCLGIRETDPEDFSQERESLLHKILRPVVDAWANRMTQLSSPEFPIQICVFRDCATADLSYLPDSDAAELSFRRLWAYLVVAESAAQVELYDPQIQKNIDLLSDYEISLEKYLHVSKEVESLAEKLNRSPEEACKGERHFHDFSIGLEGVVSGTNPVQGKGTLNGEKFYFHAQHTGWEFIVTLQGDVNLSTIDSSRAKDRIFVDGDNRCYVTTGYYGPDDAASYMHHSTAEQLIRNGSAEFLKHRQTQV